MARRNHVLERFTPAEAEMVTGVNVALQRDWRRRKLLPETGGAHARYTASELAEMLLMQDFASEGLGPKVMKDLLGSAAKPLQIWVEALGWTKGVVELNDAIPRNQLPERYVLNVAGRTMSVGDLNEAFDRLAADTDRRYAFVCDLRRVAEVVVDKIPRPVWRREPPAAAKAVA